MAIIDPTTGKPATRSKVPAMPARMDGYEVRSRLGLSGRYSYRAAELSSQEMGSSWLPPVRSADGDVNRFRDRMVGRGRDLVRNDGMAKGAVDRILDNVIGGYLRLLARPDYRALHQLSGNKAFDAIWADEMRRAIEARWRIFSENPGHYNDVGQQLSFSQQMRLAARHQIIDGENLTLTYWLPERIGIGGANYATSFQIIDPDLLSNPDMQPDTRYMRGGVQIDDLGVPVAYHIRKAHQFDLYDTAQSMEWEPIPRMDEDGWQRVIHDYDRERAGQHRGVGVFTSILPHAVMLAKHFGLKLQASNIAATFGTYIRSAQDPGLMDEILGVSDDSLSALQEFRGEYYDQNPVILNGTRIPIVAPGDSIETVSSQMQEQGFSEFTREMQRLMAAGLGVSTEQVSQAWAEMNYSSARASMIEIWKTMDRRSANFGTGTYTPHYVIWLREAFERGDFDEFLPQRAPSFLEATYAYSCCDWLGPGRGWIDPIKEPQGSTMAMDAGLSTLKRECAAQGRDWEEEVDQRAIEIKYFKDRGILPPEWSQEIPVYDNRPEEKPEAE